MIQHTVAFRLGPEADARAFWEGVATLAHIDDVIDFTVLQQVGSKNNFEHALSMFFETRQHYDGYNDHPSHVAFVENLWLPNVAEFIELDYVQA